MKWKTTESGGGLGLRWGVGKVQCSFKNPFVQAIGISVLLWASIFGGIWWYQNTRTAEFADHTLGLTFRYSTKLAGGKPMSDQDRKDKVLFRIGQGDDMKEMVRVLVRYEDGLRKVANLQKQSIIDILLANSDKTFTREHIKYDRLSQRKFVKNGHDGAEIVFTYLSPYGQFIKERYVILVRDDDSAVYVSAQAKKDDFRTVNNNDFEKIFKTLDFTL